MGVVKIVVLVIVLFILLILPHEFGHFITAKAFGVKVNEFAFGMGPILFKKKKGETLYSWRLFPIGGFCAMEDENGDSEGEDKESRGYFNKKPWQKLIILCAGSIMNIVTALVTLFVVFMIIGGTSLKLAVVEPGSPAGLAGIMPNDKIVSIDGVKLNSWDELADLIQGKNGDSLDITVKRNGETLTYNVTPTLKYILNDENVVVEKRYVVGFSSKISHNPLSAVKESFVTGWDMYRETFKALGMLFTGKAGIDEVSGPVGIVKVVADTNIYGMYYYALIVALLCLNLAIVNMLPFPALDGGRVLLLLIGVIIGRKVSPKVENTIDAVGMIILLSFTAFITVKDIFNLF